MGVVVLPAIVTSFTLGFLFKNGGLTLPGSETTFDIWGFLVKDKPQDATSIFIENLLVYLPLYTLAHCILYFEPQRSLFRPFKLNPRYPPHSLVLRELLRSLRGVAICTALEVVVNKLHVEEVFPTSMTPEVTKIGPDGAASLLGHLVTIPLVYMWGDAHFYWSHRLLHTPWLYKRVHKEHHESFNPDPFSGLSMHWAESTIYFSSAILISPIVPLWVFRLLSLGLLIFPLEGHWGYGNWKSEGSVNHYLHHAKFNWNYGSSPMWDHLMGTNYTGSDSGSARADNAIKQAALVGCSLADGDEQPEKKKE